MFEDGIGVSINRKWKMCSLFNCQEKRNRQTNNVRQITTQKTKDRTTRTLLKTATRKQALKLVFIANSNVTSFLRFANNRTIYLDGKISLVHTRCTHVDELSSVRIWQTER